MPLSKSPPLPPPAVSCILPTSHRARLHAHAVPPSPQIKTPPPSRSLPLSLNKAVSHIEKRGRDRISTLGNKKGKKSELACSRGLKAGGKPCKPCRSSGPRNFFKEETKKGVRFGKKYRFTSCAKSSEKSKAVVISCPYLPSLRVSGVQAAAAERGRKDCYSSRLQKASS